MAVPLQRRRDVVALLALQTIGGAIYAYFTLFATFRSWDDEGTFLLWDRHLLEGAALYDEVWNIYGPLPYVARWVLHAVGGVPVTHDASRLVTIVLWLGSAAALSLATYRITSSLLAGVLANLLVLRYVTFLINEPGHAQEYLLVLLGLIVLAATFVDRSPRAALAVLGMAAASAVFVKVNAGAYVVLALVLSGLLVAPRTRWALAARTVVAVALLAVPTILLAVVTVGAPDAGGASPWGAFAWSFAIGTALVLAVASRLQGMLPMGATAWAVGAAALTSVVAIGLPMVLFGSSLGAILYGVFLLPSQQFAWTTSWSAGERLGDVRVVVASVAVFALAATAGRRRPLLCAIVQTAFGLGVCLLVAVHPPQRALYPLMLRLVLPWLWVTLASDRERCQLARAFPRLVLVMCSVAQALYVYPVTGTQTMLATFLFVVCGVVALHDGVAALLERFPQVSGGRVRRVGASALVASLVVAYGLIDAQAWAAYRRGTPLGLPGASRIRLDEEPRVVIFRWLAHNVAANCQTFLGVPSLGSLYLWAGVPSPGRLGRSFVLDLYDRGHQQAMIDALERFPGRCVVLGLGELSTWLDGGSEEILQLPLVIQADHAYDVAGDLWGWVLLTPKGRVRPPLTYAGCTVEPGGDPWVTINLTLPPLDAGAVTRLALVDLGDGRLLADTASHSPGTALEIVRPARLDLLDLVAAQDVTLRTPVRPPADGLIVVRFYDATGAWREAVPVIGPCTVPPVAAS